MIDRRTVIAGLAVGTGSYLATHAAGTESIGGGSTESIGGGSTALTPEAFGAKGDGITNDSAAFAALATHVNSQGGGTIVFRPVTYLIGSQALTGPGEPFAYEPLDLLKIENCSRPLAILGNGAILRCAPGLRFGTFNRKTGRPTQNPLPFYGDEERATPYMAMISISNCRERVEVSDLELDGNLGEMVIGGPWGDVGHQIAAYGLALYNNSGTELIRNVYTHHHAIDGLLIDGLDTDRRARSRMEKVRSEYNARQGCSIVGGRGYDFSDCHFSHTGKAGLGSPPGAGVDIEAEGKQVRDLTFTNCHFTDNAGPALVADTGDSENATFRECTFVGTSNWAAWPRKPLFQFSRCTFIGSVVNPYDDRKRPERATKFIECKFSDDASRSPTRQVYGTYLLEASASPSVAFAQCSFEAMGSLLLPWTIGVTYENCSMVQRSKTEAYPRGQFRGKNTIIGRVDLNGSDIVGHVTVNGVKLPQGLIG